LMADTCSSRGVEVARGEEEGSGKRLA